MKLKYLLPVLLVAVSFSSFSQFKINEYSCSNVNLTNPIGVGTQISPDWVELINTTPSIQTITTWYISNDRNNLLKWQVPLYNNAPIKIDSFSTQVIFLDTYDKALPGTVGTQTVDLHANFQLNQTQANTWIYLTKGSPVGTKPYDSVMVQRSKPGNSWGKPNSDSAYTTKGTYTPNTSLPNGYRLYQVPTPGKKNPINPSPITTTRNWFVNYAPTPKLSPAPGYYSGVPAITVTDTTTLSTTFSSLEIYGSFDCTVPTLTTSSSVADVGNGSGPVTLPNSGAYMVRAVIMDQTVPPTYLPSFEAYGAYVVDSSYHMNVTCVCMDTNSLFITRSKDTVPTMYSYMDKNTKKQVFKNSGQALIKKIDFYNNIGAPAKQWQFQFRSEDEYGYNYTNKYPFYQDGNLGQTARADFPELVFRSSAEDEFLPGGGGSSAPSFQGYGYGPDHVRDFFNHTITLRHKLDIESSHYTPTYLFINGTNRGIYYIKEPMDTSYTQYYYNFPQANIIANDLVPTTSTSQITALAGSLAQWITFYNSIMSPSYNIHVPSLYQQLGAQLDFQSFCDYNFYNMFSVNTDFNKRQALWWQGVADTSNHGSRKWRFALSNTDNTWGFGNDFTGIADNSPTSSPCDYINAFGPGANTQYPLIPLFGKLMTNDTFKSNFLSRYQDLLNTSYSCDSLTDHFKYIRSLVMADIPSQAYWFANPDSVIWSAMADSMNIFLTQRCSLAVQGLKNCYGYDGPYNLCVDVSPPNAGYVKFNSLTLHSFVWNGKYLDSVTNIAFAIPDSNYVFDHWETPYNVNPSKTSDSINFFIDRDACIKAVFKLKPAYETTGQPMLPSAFSPNGDGNNDILNIYGIANASSYDFEIYNRWGENIFHSMDKTQGWDGTYNGVAAPVGVYAYWYNIVISGKTYNKKGSFTLLR
jgi:gliding motility-associated-like protein